MDKHKFKIEIADRLGGFFAQYIFSCIDVNNITDINEIRLRANKPVSIICNSKLYFVNKKKGISLKCENPYIITHDEISTMFARICRNSMYAFADDIKNGFVTIPGGHRVGICGKMQSDGTIRDISCMNIRIAKEVLNCAKDVIPSIIRGSNDIKSTLIISPPCCGKTTLVRDIARVLSNGFEKPFFQGVNVGIVDERSEIAACCNGVPSNDVGVRTDVLDACPKEKGIYMMLRAMSPRVIITDEIGGPGDYRAVASAINSGVRLIATAHGRSIEEVRSRHEIGNMIDDRFFERYIVLSSEKGPGTIEKII